MPKWPFEDAKMKAVKPPYVQLDIYREREEKKNINH
jgi:hypothetical protein